MSYIYDDYVFHYMVDDGLTYLCLADEQQKRRVSGRERPPPPPTTTTPTPLPLSTRAAALPPAPAHPFAAAQIPFLFLADVRDKFAAAYGSRAKTAIAYAMPEFARTLADRMTYFNDNPAADAFGKVKDQLAEVKDVMVENIGACALQSAARRLRARRRHPTAPRLCRPLFVRPRAERVLARGEKIELLVDKSDQLNQSARKFQKSSKSLKNVMWYKNVKMWAMIAVIILILIWLISSIACGFDYKCLKSNKP
jgi:vesicle-associated membrane protein 7